MTTTQGPKYMYERNIPKWRLWKLSEPEKYGRGIMGLLKNAYGEQPLVCTTIFIAAAACCYGIPILLDDIKNGTRTGNKTYKRFYTVYRPDDPKISKENNQWLFKGKQATLTTSNPVL